MNATPTPVPTNSAPTSATPAPDAEAAPVESTKKLGITIATKAVDAVRRQLVKRGTPEASLRVGIRGGGCSGFSYVIEFHDGPPRAKDHVFDCKDSEGNDVRIVCDPKSLVYLNGSVLDWEQTLMRQGFKFVNPQEKTSCGCGHSFTV